MPFNLIKEYSALLELLHLNSHERVESLKRIFNRDIESNPDFKFKGKVIRPVKKDDGVSSMDTLFNHLITEDEIAIGVDGLKYIKRVFEIDRSQRLHWVRFLIELRKEEGLEVFSVLERDTIKRKDVIKTYIYDIGQKYVIVLEPQSSNMDYYFLTAYHLNKDFGPKQMAKKLKKKLPEIY